MNADFGKLQGEIQKGFATVNQRLGGIEQTQRQGFADMQLAIHGVMFKLLAASEITEIRSKMENPPSMETMPFWAIR